MNNWIKVLAVAVPVGTGAGYWAINDREDPAVGSSTYGAAPETMSAQQPHVIEDRGIHGGVERKAVADAVANALPTAKESSLPKLLDSPADLNQSDAAALAAVAELSPALTTWLVPQEQVRKWVLAIDLLADGKLPQRHRPMVLSAPSFKVEPVGGQENGIVADKQRYRAASENDQRFNTLVQALEEIDARTAGRYYQAWLPMLEQAYAELGKQGSFNQRMVKAVDQVLAAKAMIGDGVLKQPHVLYEFESAQLEQSSALNKALWRLGDANRQTVQRFLKELKFYL